jgi:hypothetical protein
MVPIPWIIVKDCEENLYTQKLCKISIIIGVLSSTMIQIYCFRLTLSKQLN